MFRVCGDLLRYLNRRKLLRTTADLFDSMAVTPLRQTFIYRADSSEGNSVSRDLDEEDVA